MVGSSSLGLTLSSLSCLLVVTPSSSLSEDPSSLSDLKGSVKGVLPSFEVSDDSVPVASPSTSNVGFCSCCCCPCPVAIPVTFTLYDLVILEGLFSQDIFEVSSFSPSVMR